MLRELILEDENSWGSLPIVDLINESVRLLQLQKNGGKVTPNIKGAEAFFKGNPKLVASAASMALSAYMEYNKNKRHTLKLHARSPYEKKMVTSVVDAMCDSGEYKVKKIQFGTGGAKTWVLRKV